MSGWLKSFDGWTWGEWRIRGPIFGRSMFWVYRAGSRYTPSGRFDDAVSFPSITLAKGFVLTQIARDSRGTAR